MAEIKASVNVFALLDGDDPGDKRLADFNPRHKDQPKKEPVLSAAACDYKLKLMKPKPSPSPPAAGSKAPRKIPTPAVADGLRPAAAASRKKSTMASQAVAAGLRSTAAASMARSMNKQPITNPAPPPPAAARKTNLTRVLFNYPSARERIFKERQERQEEFERRQAQLAAEKENSGRVSGDDDDKSAAAGAQTTGKGKEGKTHGVKVQGQYNDPAKQQQPAAAVKKAPAPLVSKEVPRAPVVLVLQTPPPPSIDDVAQFPSLK